MTCRQFGAELLSKPMLDLLSIGPLETNFSEIFNQNTKLFIQENVFENVVRKMAAILSRPQCVKAQKGALNVKNCCSVILSAE